MNFAPIIIPTLCRDIHLKRCIDSLKKCRYSEETELIIGLDHPKEEKHQSGYNNICQYLEALKGFKKITIIKHQKNIGASENIRYLQDIAYQKYDRLIFTEDDNEFSPCFLEYMNHLLEIYKDNIQILSISGYTNESMYNLTSSNIFPTIEVSSWGIGLWKNKSLHIKADYYIETKKILQSYRKSWKLYRYYPASFAMLIRMTKEKKVYGDVIRTMYNILNNTREIRPSISLVRNWGHDGSGLHCTQIEQSFSQQKILTEESFDLDSTQTILSNFNNKKIRTKIFYNNLPKAKVKAWLFIFRIGMSYLKYRLLY